MSDCRLIASSCRFSTKKVTLRVTRSPSWASLSATWRDSHQAAISSSVSCNAPSRDISPVWPLVFTTGSVSTGGDWASFSRRSRTVDLGMPNSRLISVWVLPSSCRALSCPSSSWRVAMKVSLAGEYPQNLHDKPHQYERHRDVRPHHPLEPRHLTLHRFNLEFDFERRFNHIRLGGVVLRRNEARQDGAESFRLLRGEAELFEG